MASVETGFAHELPDDFRPQGTENLLGRLGGEDALEAVVEKFYDRVVQDDDLKEFFEKTDMPVLMAHQKRFMTVAFTEIPDDFDVKGYIIERHYRLFDKGLNEYHFDRVIKHLAETLASFGVSAELIAETKTYLDPFREVFEKTKREDIMTYLKKSIGNSHRNRIEQARIARQREKEEKERKANKKTGKSKSKPSSNRSVGSKNSALDSIQE